MIKTKVINFFLLVVSFLLLVSLINGVNRSYTVAQQVDNNCKYLRWDGGLWGEGKIPVTSSSQPVVGPSPITVSGSNVGIGLIVGGPVYTLQVEGTTSVKSLCFSGTNCRSSWPSGSDGSGSNYWLFSQQNYLYPSSSTWKVSIGSSTVPSTTLHVFGNVTANNFLGVINASNVSAGQFASSTGGGIFTFPSHVLIGVTFPSSLLGGLAGLEATGTIKASRICIGQNCYQNWPSISAIPVKIPFYNGLLYPPTTSWASVYPVIAPTEDKVKRDGAYYFPYISFKDVINNLSLDGNATVTPWFDLFYGFHHINEPGYDKALYVEESDNSYPLSWYATTVATMTCSSQTVFKRDNNNCDDLFGGATFYDNQGVLRSTSSETFLINNCFNSSDINDGCQRMGSSLNLFSTSSPIKGRVILELRVVGWQKPTTSYACSDYEYIPRMRLQSWNKPNDIFLKITKYKNVTTTPPQCVGALLRSKIQGRFVVDPIKAYKYDGSQVEFPPSPLLDIKDNLQGDFVFVFKEVGLAILSWVRN